MNFQIKYKLASVNNAQCNKTALNVRTTRCKYIIKSQIFKCAKQKYFTKFEEK